MKKIPKENISQIISDIKYPGLEEKVRKNYFSPFVPPVEPAKTGGIPAKTLVIPAILGLLVGFYLLNILNFRNNVLASVKTIYNEAQKIKNSAGQMDVDGAVDSLKTINSEIKTSESQADEYGLFRFSSLIGELVPAFKAISPAVENFSLLSGKTLEIAEEINYLKNNGIQLITQGKGRELISALEKMGSDLTAIEALNASMKTQSAELKNLSPKLSSLSNVLESNFMPISSELYQLKNFTLSLASLLKSDNAHILLAFQNPSEIRPGGGFIGSFGDIAISQGNLKKITIDDIYNADRQMTVKSVPPRELQNITREWGARDANWFFDFPTSAQKVIGFLENSEMFAKSKTVFQAAIAINTNVVASMLNVLGPIEIPEYGLIVNGDNFLAEIQREVENGRDHKPGQNPKKVLSVMAPIVMEKFSNLDDKQKMELLKVLENHLDKKDVMIYSTDWKMQDFLIANGAAGEIADLPKNFSGDYLAVVNANVWGGKTDAFIKQKISLKSAISPDGKITDNVSVTRSHNGQDQTDSWYLAEDKNYIKILTPLETQLLAVKGSDSQPAYKYKKLTAADYSYPKNNFEYDLNLRLMEQSASFIDKYKTWMGQESGKTYFGTWMNILAGESQTLDTAYKRNNGIEVKDGASYKFIFEKQSGVNTAFEYSVTAPAGFVWKESDANKYEFSASEPNSREIISLTLKKI
ncbi:MAG: DUF4012 domain-containing protein [Candidatus Pacebacteria bacterium]|nr:DUF4012 domain-containing protein [Candidatus Paceibacterota bacterium]